VEFMADDSWQSDVRRRLAGGEWYKSFILLIHYCSRHQISVV
jgi:hypothetical protein